MFESKNEYTISGSRQRKVFQNILELDTISDFKITRDSTTEKLIRVYDQSESFSLDNNYKLLITSDKECLDIELLNSAKNYSIESKLTFNSENIVDSFSELLGIGETYFNKEVPIDGIDRLYLFGIEGVIKLWGLESTCKVRRECFKLSIWAKECLVGSLELISDHIVSDEKFKAVYRVSLHGEIKTKFTSFLTHFNRIYGAALIENTNSIYEDMSSVYFDESHDTEIKFFIPNRTVFDNIVSSLEIKREISNIKLKSKYQYSYHEEYYDDDKRTLKSLNSYLRIRRNDKIDKSEIYYKEYEKKGGKIESRQISGDENADKIYEIYRNLHFSNRLMNEIDIDDFVDSFADFAPKINYTVILRLQLNRQSFMILNEDKSPFGSIKFDELIFYDNNDRRGSFLRVEISANNPKHYSRLKNIGWYLSDIYNLKPTSLPKAFIAFNILETGDYKEDIDEIIPIFTKTKIDLDVKQKKMIEELINENKFLSDELGAQRRFKEIRPLDLNSKISYWETLISNGRTEYVVKEMQNELSSNLFGNYKNEIVILCSEFSRDLKKIINGTIDSDYESRVTNNVNIRLLKIFDDLQSTI